MAVIHQYLSTWDWIMLSIEKLNFLATYLGFNLGSDHTVHRKAELSAKYLRFYLIRIDKNRCFNFIKFETVNTALKQASLRNLQRKGLGEYTPSFLTVSREHQKLLTEKNQVIPEISN